MSLHSHSIFRTAVLLAAVMVPLSAAEDTSVAVAPDVSSDSSDLSSLAEPIEGFTEPFADVRLAASEMGALSRIDVEDGDVVKAGQVIASLDDRVLKASLSVAEAAAKAKGEVESAKASLQLRELEHSKIAELFGRNHASQKELDRAQGDLRIAKARLQIAEEETRVRKLEQDRMQAQLLQRQVVSPIDGVVVEVMKEAGEFVSPSDPAVARIVQLNPLLIAFSVPAEQRDRVVPKQTVLMTVGKESNIQGQVEFVSPIADASSGTFRVKVKLPNPAGRWHGGEKSVLHLDQDSLDRARQTERLAKKEG